MKKGSDPEAAYPSVGFRNAPPTSPCWFLPSPQDWAVMGRQAKKEWGAWQEAASLNTICPRRTKCENIKSLWSWCGITWITRITRLGSLSPWLPGSLFPGRVRPGLQLELVLVRTTPLAAEAILERSPDACPPCRIGWRGTTFIPISPIGKLSPGSMAGYWHCNSDTCLWTLLQCSLLDSKIQLSP